MKRNLINNFHFSSVELARINKTSVKKILFLLRRMKKKRAGTHYIFINLGRLSVQKLILLRFVGAQPKEKKNLFDNENGTVKINSGWNATQHFMLAFMLWGDFLLSFQRIFSSLSILFSSLFFKIWRKLHVP